MGLDVYLEKVMLTTIYSRGITHNLNSMAEEAGIYKHLWRPDEIGIVYAKDLIEPLRKGLHELRARPLHYKQFNPINGWGSYGDLLEFVQEYLNECIENPDATVHACR